MKRKFVKMRVVVFFLTVIFMVVESGNSFAISKDEASAALIGVTNVTDTIYTIYPGMPEDEARSNLTAVDGSNGWRFTAKTFPYKKWANSDEMTTMEVFRITRGHISADDVMEVLNVTCIGGCVSGCSVQYATTSEKIADQLYRLALGRYSQSLGGNSHRYTMEPVKGAYVFRHFWKLSNIGKHGTISLIYSTAAADICNNTKNDERTITIGHSSRDL